MSDSRVSFPSGTTRSASLFPLLDSGRTRRAATRAWVPPHIASASLQARNVFALPYLLFNRLRAIVEPHFFTLLVLLTSLPLVSSSEWFSFLRPVVSFLSVGRMRFIRFALWEAPPDSRLQC